jgi:serine/threonine protein kinase
VPGAAGAGAPGAFVCPACRDHPETVLRALLQEALSPAGPAPGLRGYEIVRELGAGGMGAVYLARAPDGSEVAVKVMLPRVAASPRAAATFLREAELARSLRHPHVVGLREAGCADGVFFLTMEYCPGGSVADLQRRRGGRLPWQEAVPLVLQALDGLAYAHAAPLALTQGGDRAEARGLVHRDVKPANLLLAGATGAWSVKVADFGLAKAFDLAGLSGQTLTGGVGGTPRFMPRQQVVNFKYARPEVDVWAAAACLYFLLTGCPPREYARGRDPWQVTLQTDRVPVHRREHGRSLPRRLADLLDEALVDRPAIPFTTAAAFKAALEGAIG